MTDILVAEPTVEPISLAAAKEHIRETTNAQDSLVSTILAAAREHAETYCRRAFVLQTRKLVLDCFPAVIEIPRAPLRAVLSIKYIDQDEVLQTLSSSLYRVDKESRRARITPAYGQVWPIPHYITNAVQVEYACGHLVPFTADAGADTLTPEAGHGLVDGNQTPVETIGGVLPGGLTATATYHVRDLSGATFKLAATAAGAALDITSAGTPPNVLGRLPKPITHALQVLVQYFEQRNADEKLREAAENLLSPYRVVRF